MNYFYKVLVYSVLETLGIIKSVVLLTVVSEVILCKTKISEEWEKHSRAILVF